MPTAKASSVLILIVLTALVMRAPINAVGPMADSLRSVFDLSWSTYGLLTAIPMWAFGIYSPFVAGTASRLGAVRFLAAALIGLASGSVLRGFEDTALLFLGTVLLSTSIAGLNVFMPALIKTTFPHKTAETMAAYTTAMGVGGLLGTALSQPLAVACHAWFAPFIFWGLAALLPLALSLTLRFDTTATTGTRHRQLRAPVARLMLMIGLQGGLTVCITAVMPSGLHSFGWTSSEAMTAVNLFVAMMIPGSAVCSRLTIRPALYPTVATLYAASLWTWTTGAGAHIGLLTAATLLGLLQGMLVTISLTTITRTSTPEEVLQVSGRAQFGGYLLAGTLAAGIGRWISVFGISHVPALLTACVAAWALTGWSIPVSHED